MTLALHSAKPSGKLTTHTRVEELWKLAATVGARTIVVAKADGQRLDMVCSLPITTDRAQIAQLVGAAQDEAAGLEAGTNWPFVFLIQGEQGNEIARERIRFPGSKAPVQRALTQDEIDRGGGAVQEDASNAIGRYNPRESASLYGIARQQMRHTEAVTALLVRNAETTVNSLTKQNEVLSQRVDLLTDRNIKQAESVIAAHSQNRLIEAQARREEVETEALRTTAQVLAEWLPLGLHRIARKYGLAGDAELDPMLEKMISSFEGPQIDALQKILTPVQRGMFAEMWMKVDGRKEKKEDAAKKKKAEAAATVDKLTGTQSKGAEPSKSGEQPKSEEKTENGASEKTPAK